MKCAKPQHRIPWWCFDEPYEKPATNYWKKFQRRVERLFWKKSIREENND